MQDFPVEYALAGPYVHEQYDPVLIHEYLMMLQPSNVGYMLIAPEFPENTTLVFEQERWYGTEYCVQELSKEFLAQLADAGVHEDLHLPHHNEFIPETFDVHRERGKVTS